MSTFTNVSDTHFHGTTGTNNQPLASRVDATIDEIETAVTANETDIDALQLGVPLLATLNITTTEMTAATTTQTFDIVTPSATYDAVVLDAWFKTTTLVSGGTIDSAVLEIGNDEATADPNAYVLQTDVFTGASTGYQGVLYTSKGTDLVTVNTADYGRNTAILSATQKIQAKLTTGTGDVADATAGDLTCYVLYMLLV